MAIRLAVIAVSWSVFDPSTDPLKLTLPNASAWGRSTATTTDPAPASTRASTSTASPASTSIAPPAATCAWPRTRACICVLAVANAPGALSLAIPEKDMPVTTDLTVTPSSAGAAPPWARTRTSSSARTRVWTSPFDAPSTAAVNTVLSVAVAVKSVAAKPSDPEPPRISVSTSTSPPAAIRTLPSPGVAPSVCTTEFPLTIADCTALLVEVTFSVLLEPARPTFAPASMRDLTSRSPSAAMTMSLDSSSRSRTVVVASVVPDTNASIEE